MKPEEANKIIAEFMGWKYGGWSKQNLLPDKCINVIKSDGSKRFHRSYFHSLDALVPVWEKLREIPEYVFTPYMTCNPLGFYEFEVTPSKEGKEGEGKWDNAWGNSRSPQEAAAIATAIAILELNNEVG